MVKLISCQIDGTTGNNVDTVTIVMESEDREYMIWAISNENKGLSDVEDIRGEEYVLDRTDLDVLITFSAGKYSLRDWKLVPSSFSYDMEIMVFDEDIPMSEIGVEMKTIPVDLLEIDGNIAIYNNNKYYLKCLSSKPKEFFIEEVRRLSQIDHLNIIRVEALVTSSDDMVLGMMTPLANKGTLEDNSNSNLKALWLSQVKDAIGYCKDIGIEYTDIKPKNMVIYDDNAILIDFDGGTTRDWNMKKFEEYMA